MAISPKKPQYLRGGPAQSVADLPQEEADLSGLSVAAQERILAELEDEIRAEENKRKEEEFRARKRQELRRRKGLEEPQVTLQVDVAGFANNIMLDGVQYWHGEIYTVPKSIADTLLDQMQRTWDHEASVGGANQNQYRKPLSERVGGRSYRAPVAVHAGQFAPVVTTTGVLSGRH